MPFLGKTPVRIIDTNVNIDGGNVDNTIVGASTAAAGTFTTFTSNGIDDNADATAITIDSSENVGIGTDSPDQLLDVGDHTSFGDRSIRISQRTATAAQTYGGIEFFYDNSLTNAGVNAAIYYAAGTARNNGELTFHTGTSASISERLRIDHDGNVGIGTASPSAFDQVGADTLVVGSGSGEQGITIYSGTANNGVLAFADGTTTTEQYQGYLAYNHSSNFMRFFTAASERMRIDSSGNVGIGTTTPVTNLEVEGSGAELIRISSSSGNSGASIGAASLGLDYFTSTTNPAVLLSAVESGVATFLGDFTIATRGSNSDAAPTERVRIDSSGNLLVGRTSTPAISNSFDMGFRPDLGTLFINCASATGPLMLNQTTGDTATRNQIRFHRNETEVGNITSSTSATAYNTSSDVRLKENIVDAPAGSLDDIQVRSFDWKADGSHQKHGLVAQELVSVAPEAVHQGETDDEMWSVDYSKLVPMMIKEIQDLKAEVTALKGE